MWETITQKFRLAPTNVKDSVSEYIIDRRTLRPKDQPKTTDKAFQPASESENRSNFDSPTKNAPPSPDAPKASYEANSRKEFDNLQQNGKLKRAKDAIESVPDTFCAVLTTFGRSSLLRRVGSAKDLKLVLLSQPLRLPSGAC